MYGTIIGGGAKLAARLESSADPGGILLSNETWALVKDVVAADERGSITMKGIRRKARSFAVTNCLRDLARERRVIHHEVEGLCLHPAAGKLAGAARREAVVHLRTALDRLDSDC